MAKAGDEYQNIVASVVQALSPYATVSEGEWVTGPDGRRDRDVTVRDNINGRNIVVVIECKDWTRPVGIGTIDALESKSRDLDADLTFICSNSGFARQALQKCERVGIVPISVLLDNDARIRAKVERKIFAELHHLFMYAVTALTVENESVDEDALVNSLEVDPYQVFYQAIPLANWLQDIFEYLTVKYPERQALIAQFSLFSPTKFLNSGEPIIVAGFRVVLVFYRKWLSQTTSMKASTAIYDYTERAFMVPKGEGLELRLEDDNWKPTEEPNESEKFNEIDVFEPQPLRVPVRLIDSPLEIVEGIDTSPIHDLIEGEYVYPENYVYPEVEE